MRNASASGSGVGSVFALDIFFVDCCPAATQASEFSRCVRLNYFQFVRTSVRGGVIRAFMDRMGEQGGPLRRRHSGEGRAVPELSPFDPDFHLTSRRTI